jgi:hypothetical protein
MGNIQTLNPQPSPYSSMPLRWNTQPHPGKLQELWAYNSKQIYHRNSPYTDYDISLASKFLGDVEPYYYTYIDKAKQGLAGWRRWDSRTVPLGSSLIDTVRVTRFLGSGRGIIFLAKQFLLQTGNSYNETRIYNPTSPILSTVIGLSAGSVRPQRNFDTSAGLAGIVGSVLGSSIQSSLFGAPKINPPSGTTGRDALPFVNQTTGGKGLLRAQTANNGLAHLKAAWGQPTNSSGFMASLFANFIPAKQSGITFKSDEGAYGLMLSDKKAMLSYTDVTGNPVDFTQLWVGGGKIMRKNKEYPANAARNFVDTNGNQVGYVKTKLSTGQTITNVGQTGYDVAQSKRADGFRYGDSVGVNSITKLAANDNYQGSDLMIQYGMYVDPKNTHPYPTSKDRVGDIDSLNNELLKVLSKANILNLNDKNHDPFQPTYTAMVPLESRIVGSGLSHDNGYTRIFNAKNRGDKRSGYNYKLGVLKEYRETGTRLVSDDIVATKKKSLRLPTSNVFDAINTLTVIPGGSIDKTLDNMTGWGGMSWKPYDNDLVAF